jgi:lysophospholipase L1-like esterase
MVLASKKWRDQLIQMHITTCAPLLSSFSFLLASCAAGANANEGPSNLIGEGAAGVDQRGHAGPSISTEAGSGSSGHQGGGGNTTDGRDGGGDQGDGGPPRDDAGARTNQPEPAAIQYYGRWDHGDPQSASASWGAVYLKAKFEGTSVGIKLTDPNNDYQYSIDGAPMKILVTTAATEYPLASGLPDGAHRLELYRRSEGAYGRTVVSGLILDPGKKLLPPDPRPPHRIEVLGDSISAGFGDEHNVGGGSDRHSQNGYMAYGPQLARLLDAEWSIIAHSGQGMFRNLGEAIPPTSKHMPDEFKLTQFPGWSGLPNPDWSFATWRADVLIITLGTNDFADYGGTSPPYPTDTQFGGAYGDFLSMARSVYPQAEIFAVGTFLSTAQNQFGKCNSYVCNVVKTKNAAGDSHIHCIDPGFTASSGAWLPDGTYYIGDWTHPTIAGHTVIAEHLRDIIKPIMGW